MALNPRLLRRLFAAGAVILVLIVSAFYVRGILREKPLGNIPTIPADVAQSTKGFTFSKSEGGRTIFTIHAAQEEQLKESDRAELHDVNIVVYGRQSNRFDQIYGSEFQYDPHSGDVVANGDVNIDLEGDKTGASRPDQAPPQEIKNPIHLKTSGLIFNRNSGLAETSKHIEFHLPEASGSAVGAIYDSRNNLLTLESAVRMISTGKKKFTVTAQKAVMTKDPRRAVLQSAQLEQQSQSVQANKVTLLLREDNTIERVLGDGDVILEDTSPKKGFRVTAPQAEMQLAGKQQIRSGVLLGGVALEGTGPAPPHGTAKRLLLDFGAKNQVTRAHAEDSVQLSQGPEAKSTMLQADAVDMLIGNGKKLEKAYTSGAAQVLITQGKTKTTITAGQFDGAFNSRNRLSSISGGPNVRTVSTTPGKTDQTTSSDAITATFNNQNTIQEVEQNGNFHYQQGSQTASSDRARYLAEDENVTLTGSPRVHDTDGMVTAQTIRLNRKTGIVVAQNDVKTTYTDLKPQANGGMLGSSDPIHVTGTSMVANQKSGEARFTHARLWQNANIVEAPAMTFDREHRSLQAESSGPDKVKCAFVQVDKAGKLVPVDVTSDHLTYVDAERKAVFSGNVVVRSSETTMVADNAQVFLAPGDGQQRNQLDHIVAQGDIKIDQPNRKATGNHLVYTAQDDKMVLTASQGRRPVIFDSQHGQVTGDSLTFYRHDDRVVVEGQKSSQTVTQTRIPDASKK